MTHSALTTLNDVPPEWPACPSSGPLNPLFPLLKMFFPKELSLVWVTSASLGHLFHVILRSTIFLFLCLCFLFLYSTSDMQCDVLIILIYYLSPSTKIEDSIEQGFLYAFFTPVPSAFRRCLINTLFPRK